MWPFFLTRSVNVSKTIPVSKPRLLSILHDPEQALRVSPLVFSVIQDPPDTKDPSGGQSGQWYTLTERLPMLGGLYESSTTFRCRYEKKEDGYDAEVLAGAGTRLTSEARVEEGTGEDEGSVVFSEKLVVEGVFFLMPYIVSVMTKTHIAMLDIIAEKALQNNN